MTKNLRIGLLFFFLPTFIVACDTPPPMQDVPELRDCKHYRVREGSDTVHVVRCPAVIVNSTAIAASTTATHVSDGKHSRTTVTAVVQDPAPEDIDLAVYDKNGVLLWRTAQR